MENFFERLSRRSILVFLTIFFVSLAIGTILFLLLNTKALAVAVGSVDVGWLNTLHAGLGKQFGTEDAGGAGGFLQGVWGTAGSLAASFVAIVLAQQALVLARKQNDTKDAQDKKNDLLDAEQRLLHAQTTERDRSRFEFDLKRDIIEQFGPLLKSNQEVGSVLNTLFVESARLHIAVSKQVERVFFLESIGSLLLIEADICPAIARHIDADAVDSELKNVKSAMRHLYEALVANGTPLARLAVKKQLEINSRPGGAGQTLCDLFSHLLPAEVLIGLAPVDHASFAEHIKTMDLNPTPLRLVECWYQASLFGLIQQSTYLKFTGEGTIETRLDEAGEKDGVDTFSTVYKKLSQRSEAISEGLFFLGSLIALHKQTLERSGHLLDAPDHTVWRVNAGLLALIDFYNATPSKEALKLAAKQIYGSDSLATVPPPGTEGSYVDMIEKSIERLPYDHDAPGMRQGKEAADVSSILPLVYSRILVALDQIIREQRDKFFDLCIGPARLTPAQNAYIQVLSVANLRSIGAALEIHAQASTHYKEFLSYFERELYEKAVDSALLMLRDMVKLLRYYDPHTHHVHLEALQKMHLHAVAFLEAVATNGEVGSGDIDACVEVLTLSADSVRLNERLSPDSRQSYAATLLDAVQRIRAALAPA